jgi:hypothetical protein
MQHPPDPDTDVDEREVVFAGPSVSFREALPGSAGAAGPNLPVAIGLGRSESRSENGLDASYPQLLLPMGADRPRTKFRTGPDASQLTKGVPRATAWFGFRSFWGHLRRFAATAIATEDVDTRDWMEPTPPHALVTKIARELGVDERGASLVECLGRDVWIDFVADSGDDGELGVRMAHMLFRPYRALDPCDPTCELELPRGDLLLHGGDVAYPVATEDEIHNRLIVPWNRALREIGDDAQPRVLLGIPGNHDWYDGIDGYARMFRERHFAEEPEAQTEPLDFKWLGRAIAYVGQFVTGETVKKTKALVLQGYRPVQRSSYFVLPVTPTIHFYGVDRQLRRIDYRQKRFFLDWFRSHPDAARVIILHDPVLPFGVPGKSGVQTLRALRLSPEYEPHLCFAGDIHHYRRETIGRSTHVTAGGGGAFLHPVPLDDVDRAPADRQWPGPEQCKALLNGVPWHVATARSGYIAHAVLLALFAPALGIGGTYLGRDGLLSGSIVAGVFTALVLFAIGGPRSPKLWHVGGLSIASGALMGLLPALTLFALEPLADAFHVGNTWFWGFIALFVALGAGGLVFGGYLAALTALGLELTQAFTALGHPGYRHFVRMRVRADGSGVDVFCIGVEDAFDPDEKPALVDAFFWESPATKGDPARRSSAYPEPGGLRPSLDRRRRSGGPQDRSSMPPGVPFGRTSAPPTRSSHPPARTTPSIPPASQTSGFPPAISHHPPARSSHPPANDPSIPSSPPPEDEVP